MPQGFGAEALELAQCAKQTLIAYLCLDTAEGQASTELLRAR